jgi:tetratricopeptide (TPR) repeat protein
VALNRTLALSRTVALIALMPLLVQMAGCASAGARVDKSTSVPADPAADLILKPDKPVKPVRSDRGADAKAFAEAVKRGDKAWQANELDRAVYYYVLALDHSPQDALTLAKIGAIKQQNGETALAQTAFEMAHAAQPDEPRFAERLAQLYLRQGRVDSAAQVYGEVLTLHPQRARSLDGMGEVCILRADYAQSVQYLDRALQAEQADTASVLTHRGYAKLRLLDLPGAESDLRGALAVTSRPDAWRYLADLQVHEHDNAAAFSSLLKFMDSAHAYNEIGLVLLNMNDYSDSRLYFGKAISASPRWYDEAQNNLELADEHLKGQPDAAPTAR